MKQETIRDQRVDVPTQGAVNKRNENILFNFFVGFLLNQISADTPILFGRVKYLIVNPTATWGLQQRMV